MITLRTTLIPEAELDAARTLYLTRYPDSKYWVDFDDFFFYRMDVLDVYYVGGFGVMGWVAASEYSQAQSDPLVEHKKDIMQHMNADHKDALILLAKRIAGIEAQEAEMTSIDRLGFHDRLKNQDGVHGARIAFLREVRGSGTNQGSLRRDGTAGAPKVSRPVFAVDLPGPVKVSLAPVRTGERSKLVCDPKRKRL